MIDSTGNLVLSGSSYGANLKLFEPNNATAVSVTISNGYTGYWPYVLSLNPSTGKYIWSAHVASVAYNYALTGSQDGFLYVTGNTGTGAAATMSFRHANGTVAYTTPWAPVSNAPYG